MNYFAINCNKCGVWSIREINKLSTYRFICPRCNNNIKLRKVNQLWLSLKVSQRFDTIAQANTFIKSKTEHLNTGFETYVRKKE